MFVAEKKIQFIDLPVNKDFGEDEDFFRLIAPNGRELHLKKLPFQMSQPLPDKLSCRVKGYNEGTPIIGHNMPHYVSEFYADGFSAGRDFEFKVVAKPHDNQGFYRLEDSNGLQFKLQEQKSAFAIGQMVKCRFEYLDQHVFILRRSTTDVQIKILNLRDIGRILNIKSWTMDKIERSLREIPEMAKAMQELDYGNSTWILTALNTIKQILPRWFNDAVHRYKYDEVFRVLDGCRQVALYMLEGSDFLRNIKGNERTNLQRVLTNQIEQIDIFINALDIISQKGQRDFINILLDHLKQAGYIYHPVNQFSILMILFRHSPELVNSSLGQIFDALMDWYPETWKTEPFRQAFVEQLEIYIEDARNDIDQFLMPATPEENEKIEKVLTAIAIQQALATQKDNIDIMGNMSLFYRCLSLLRSAKADTLLWKSFLSLMGVRLPIDFTWNDIKEPTMMMTRAAVDPPLMAQPSPNSRYYIGDKVEIEIGQDGLIISQPDREGDALVPNRMFDWPGVLQVKASDAHAMKPAKMRSLDGHKDFWEEVEQSLFHPAEIQEAHPAAKRQPDIDDTVRIVIDGPISNSDAFHCRIVDEHFFEGEGIIEAREIVPYNLHDIKDGHFRHNDGSMMQLDAKVIEIKDNGTICFSLLESGRLAIRDLTHTDDVCNCVITKNNGPSYSAISEKGFGLFVKRDPNEPYPYPNGSVLRVRVTGFSGEYVQAEVEEGPLDNVFINNGLAMQNLLRAIAVQREGDAEADLDLDEEDLLDADEIREIAEIMRYKAVSKSDDILQAYDYLSLARILARIIEDEELADVIKAHKEILMLHKHYATNKVIYREDLDRVLSYAPNNALIQRLASKLDIVAALGNTDDNPMLWERVHNESIDATERELAQMVLSHNLLYEINHEAPAAAAIKDQIAKKLNVTSEQRKLKYYGSESQYVEFKSSIVYPAQKGKAGISLADPDKQEFEILHIIAGFLNTTGGTLYIGVSDDHYERGLEEDLKFYSLDKSERNNLYRRNIRSLDNLTNYLQNLIDSRFSLGVNAGDYAKAYIDEEAPKGVIMVKVDPCPRVVTLEGQIFVRHSAKTVPLLKSDEIQQFTDDRARLFQQQINVQANQKAAIAPIEDIPAPTPQTAPKPNLAQQAEAAPAAVAAEAVPEPVIEEKVWKLRTSKLRNNVLHEYEDPEHFAPVALYMRFIGDFGYMVTTDEWSLEDDDRLDLAFHDDEMDQYLLLIYENEYAVKVPMRELLQKRKNMLHQHNSDRKLVFACPMKEKDGLYSLHLNSKGTVYERFTPLSSIPQGTISSVGERLMEGECEQSPFYEYVPAARAAEFKDIKPDGRRKTTLGTLAKGDNTQRITPEGTAAAFYKKFE
ncbi:MAG: ATP-binding protein [Bacteroidales bacterium]|nr:ATP-binding protein [Bacteroidales bacterium]